ncbi:MAG: PEP-CTERM sorting domain-containing protein [Phycisphaerales bacterium]
MGRRGCHVTHLTPTTDQTIDVVLSYLMRSDYGVFVVNLKMFDETALVNLLPPGVSIYNLSGGAATISQDLLKAPVQVQAGHSYTVEVEYDVYPSFVPEPAACALVGAGGLALVRRKRV